MVSFIIFPPALLLNCQFQLADMTCVLYSDYNYEMSTDGSCQLVPGLDPPDHSLACQENKDLVSYFLPTGYRRTPLDTCEGGQELEYIPSKEIWCDGHKEDFEDIQRKKGLSGFAFFFFVVIVPLAVAGAVGWWVYKHWDGKLGAIRLGDGGSTTYSPLGLSTGGGGSGDGGILDPSKPWIKYPIVALSAVVAVVVATPLVIGSAWRWGRNAFGFARGRGGGDSTRRYTTRSDFARGGRYAVVDPDEDELLGDDDDDLDLGPANASVLGSGSGGGGRGGAGRDGDGVGGRDADEGV